MRTQNDLLILETGFLYSKLGLTWEEAMSKYLEAIGENNHNETKTRKNAREEEAK